MTATDPRPALAAMLAEKLAPAVEALATAYVEDAGPEPPPPDDRAIAERHRAARAQLDHLHKLLALLDWAGAHMPEPEPAPVEEPEEEPWEPPPAVKPDYDGSEDEFHYGGEAYVGSQETPEFRAWLEDMERRFGPVPIDDGRPGSLNECSVSGRTFIGKLTTPEFRAWRERQHRRTEESLARYLDRAGSAGPDRRKTIPEPRRMTKHDIA